MFNHNWNRVFNHCLKKHIWTYLIKSLLKIISIITVTVHISFSTFSMRYQLSSKSRMNIWEDEKNISILIIWNEGHFKYVMKFFVKHFETYNNKFGICHTWTEEMRNLSKYEKLRVTVRQIKNFIATQIITFHLAMEKKDSTEFDDLDDITVEDQLIEICKFWYSLMLLYITNFKELLSVLGDNALTNSVLQYQRHYWLYFPLYQTISKRLVAETEVPLVGVRSYRKYEKQYDLGFLQE